MKRLLTCALFLVGLANGCATTPPRPNVYAYPARGQSAERMSRDTAECQAWAQQQTGYDPVAEAAKGAAIGTLLGGALGAGGGAAVGAATGSGVGRGAATGAVIGGVAGGVAGGAYQYSRSKEGYEKAYAACMNGRGYVSGGGSPLPQPAPVAAAPQPVTVQPAPPAAVPAAVVVAEPRHIRVPPGHFPPPGYCRVWYPGRPPGHQPRPVACNQIAAPAGAFVLYNGVAWDTDYDWRAHARRQPGSVPPAILEMAGR